MKPFLIGITGGTASGKTTIARKLVANGGSDQVALLELDRYYRSQAHLTPEQRATVNYDHPDALEFDLLVHQLKQLLGGAPIHAPVYDFASHCRRPTQTTLIKPLPVIIVEGILLCTDATLLKLFNLKVFVHTEEEVRLSRRVDRDVRERGRSVESVKAQWHATVQPMHLQFCEPGRQCADLVVDGNTDAADVAQSLWCAVMGRREGGQS